MDLPPTRHGPNTNGDDMDVYNCHTGEMEARSEERLLKEGIRLPIETIEKLNQGAKEIHVDPLPIS